MNDGRESVPFTVFVPQTGEILRFGHCQRRSRDLQAGPGEAVLDGAYDDREYRIGTRPDGCFRAVRKAAGVVSAEDVRNETARRILDRYSVSDQLNMDDPDERMMMRAWIDLVRAAGRRLAGMTTIPANYRDARYWPD